MKKIRVFYVSYTPPMPTGGGAMAFYRHFCERDDFELQVVVNRGLPDGFHLPYSTISIETPLPWRPLLGGPMARWFYAPYFLTSSGRVTRDVREAARRFSPDVVFTIAGSWDWSALVAQKLARELGVPLVASFNDWFNFGYFPPHPIFHKALEKRFRRFYREVDLALVTCEGMRDELGPHRNSHVLYPIGSGDPVEWEQAGSSGNRKGEKTIVGFAGSMSEWYGPMLERLVTATEAVAAPIEFRFYGREPNWSSAFTERATKASIYRGNLPFAELRGAMAECDLLLLPMGFEARASLVERTSFKTKFLDYLTYQKPIVVWGPGYCSAVRTAKEFDSADVVTADDPQAVLETMARLSDDPARRAQLLGNARCMYNDRFNPEKIHGGLVSRVKELIVSKAA